MAGPDVAVDPLDRDGYDVGPMPSRRELLKVGLAASALPIAAGAELADSFSGGPSVPLYKVLYDTRFDASVVFARRAEARGIAVHAMAGDMTRFWYDDLYYRWRQGPAAIAGLTAHGPLFCLERLAWEQRMRVVHRDLVVTTHAHGVLPSEDLYSWVIAPVARA
jgi:hypothetical protein